MMTRRQIEFLALLATLQFLGTHAAAGFFTARLMGMTSEESQAIPCRAADQLSFTAGDETLSGETALLHAAEPAASKFGDWYSNVISIQHTFREPSEIAVHGRCMECDYYRWPVIETDLHGGGYCGLEWTIARLNPNRSAHLSAVSS